MAATRDVSSSWAQKLADGALVGVLEGAWRLLRALPSRWVLRIADAGGEALAVLDRRGRRVALQNLAVAFGEGMDPGRRRGVMRASFRGSVRSVLLLLHLAPMTPRRFRAWVDVPEDVEAGLRASVARGRGGILVSGHLGNWEMLLGLAALYRDDPSIPEVVYVAEALARPGLGAFLARLRGSGGTSEAARKGGARALRTHVGGGGAAALLVDRNVRRSLGGIWAPFLGLPSRTTPLPAWLAVRYGAPLRPILCLPTPEGRHRLWLGPDLTEGVDATDPDTAILEITTRANAVLERVIRAQPELWNWTLKRFKSRPTSELGPYPPYSRWDPDLPRGPRGSSGARSRAGDAAARSLADGDRDSHASPR